MTNSVILDLLKVNEQLDINLIIKFIIIYIVVFWLCVSVWVLFDAKKRFKSIIMGVVLAVANFFLLLPFLILYILVRPAKHEEYEDLIEGGVNVPIINFTDSKGVALSFELRINPRSFTNQIDPEMKIDIAFDSSDPKKIITMPEVKIIENKPKKEKIKKAFSSLKSKFANKVSAIKSKLQTASQSNEVQTSEVKPVESQPVEAKSVETQSDEAKSDTVASTN